ncbi:hypothetical protein KKG72_06760 [bacterium]|nr:hypothetical protein [bacterium]MBU1993950.1 hypothetical protein [bacterium]
MYDNDLLVAFLFMALLFVRQIYILKQPNKIDYAPLMVGIGAIGSVVHFIVHPEVENILLLLRESFFPLLVGLLLYIVMNILHQTQQSENARTEDEFTRTLVSQVTQLKEFIAELESRISANQQEDRKAQEEIREKFKHDIKALDAIQLNQGKFLEKFDDLEGWHVEVSKSFDYFSTVQMPSLDDVVHKHIDILRIAEQDHYNHLKIALEKALENKYDISEDIDALKEKLGSMQNIAESISKSITRHTLQQLSGVTQAFEKQVSTLKSHAEGIGTSLSESDSRLNAIRVQSEIIMKQMVLSSKKMNELEEQNNGLHNFYKTIKELTHEMQSIKEDYVKSQSQLKAISKELKISEDERILAMKEEIESLSMILIQKVDSSLEKLHEHYHITSEDISQSVQILAKKVQSKKGYTS